jgi:hypothetical protein
MTTPQARKTIYAFLLGFASLFTHAETKQCIPEQAKGAVQMGGGFTAIGKMCGKITQAEVTKARADGLKQAALDFPCVSNKLADWYDTAYKEAMSSGASPAEISAQCKGLEEFQRGMTEMAKTLEATTKKMKK